MDAIQDMASNNSGMKAVFCTCIILYKVMKILFYMAMAFYLAVETHFNVLTLSHWNFVSVLYELKKKHILKMYCLLQIYSNLSFYNKIIDFVKFLWK